MPLRHHSSQPNSSSCQKLKHSDHEESDDSDHEDHDHSHPHSHSHSLFGHSHAHEEGPNQEVESLVKIFEGKGDRGSNITLVGLVVNVGLTASKGFAGFFMNSAALLAEAGHSASDLLGDLVTLFAWRFSRRPPTLSYPYGFGKFETLGTTTVALILVGGALGIGVHSLTLLTHHLVEASSTVAPGPAQIILQNVTEVAQTMTNAVPLPVHDHAHAHELELDPNAAWFALISVVAKEWLYRATKRVADEERSGVLLANAVHHRSDAYTSGVALLAILGTWAFPALPLDPIGGILVALVILRQGIQLFMSAFGELTDASVSPRTRRTLEKALLPLVQEDPNLISISEVRAMRAGALLFVDVNAVVPPSLPMGDALALEARIRERLLSARKEISEVRIKYVPPTEISEKEETEKVEKL